MWGDWGLRKPRTEYKFVKRMEKVAGVGGIRATWIDWHIRNVPFLFGWVGVQRSHGFRLVFVTIFAIECSVGLAHNCGRECGLQFSLGCGVIFSPPPAKVQLLGAECRGGLRSPTSLNQWLQIWQLINCYHPCPFSTCQVQLSTICNLIDGGNTQMASQFVCILLLMYII